MRARPVSSVASSRAGSRGSAMRQASPGGDPVAQHAAADHGGQQAGQQDLDDERQDQGGEAAGYDHREHAGQLRAGQRLVRARVQPQLGQEEDLQAGGDDPGDGQHHGGDAEGGLRVAPDGCERAVEDLADRDRPQRDDARLGGLRGRLPTRRAGRRSRRRAGRTPAGHRRIQAPGRTPAGRTRRAVPGWPYPGWPYPAGHSRAGRSRCRAERRLPAGPGRTRRAGCPGGTMAGGAAPAPGPPLRPRPTAECPSCFSLPSWRSLPARMLPPLAPILARRTRQMKAGGLTGPRPDRARPAARP